MTPRASMLTRAATAALTTIVAGATGLGVGVLVAAPAYAAPGDCSPAEIIAVPGTWETNKNADPSTPVGTLKTVTDKASASSGGTISALFPAYEATAFDQGVAYADSKSDGKEVVNTTIRQRAVRCPSTVFGLVGYSQGSDIAGDVAQEIAQGYGPIPASKLGATVLIADPRRGTPGETIVGPNPPGHGIAGPRTEGFAGMKVMTICDPAPDLYCATPGDDGLLNGIGSVLGNAGLAGSNDEAPTNPADTATANDLANLNIDGLKTAPTRIQAALTSGDTAGARSIATQTRKDSQLFRSLAQSISSGYAAATLTDFSHDTAQYRASTVLDTVQSVDLDNLSKILDSLADGASSLGANQLMGSAADLAEVVGPLAGLGGSDVTAAARIVRGIQPVSLLRQASVTSGKVARIDFQGIVNDLVKLGALATVGDFPAMPDTVNSLNAKLIGIVEAVDSVDLDPLIAILQTMPLGSPERLAGDVLKVINRLDLTALAQNVALIVKYVMSGDLLAIPPLILDTLATAADTSGILDGVDLSAVSNLATSFNVADVTRSATRAISFYAGGAHQNYGQLVVDSRGRDALTWTADYFTSELGGRSSAARTTTKAPAATSATPSRPASTVGNEPAAAGN
ncbi:cutinase family protein [Rhodococcus opacus]|uniref:Cutinase family protein n=1 Tax=Rhodococcus opacus TaxID=37919 RepID=A0AAX3YQH8_RHOOP|nr:cutinase family protein [Rhodococcus opacus]MCZ4587701.1 cutinase family protein [Rhodococcus opacus]WLF51303.1 cutinase family protein [Rhodococcus opacus]